MKTYHSDTFTFPLPETHRFPEEKYTLLREAVLQDSSLSNLELLVPPAAEDETLKLAHTPDYIEKVKTGTLSAKEIRRIGLPWSPELVERSRRSVGGTVAAGQAAREEGIGVNLAGGTHHAHSSHGAGFCVFNDCAVAARFAQQAPEVQQVMILDLDVHQGDGTAEIFAGDDSVFTLSVHAAKNYPFRKQKSDLDLELEDGIQDQGYLEMVSPVIQETLEKVNPDLVLYVAGADPYHADTLGRMALTKKGLAARDRLVLKSCLDRSVPITIVMGGGYARDIEDSVSIHLETLRIVSTLWRSQQ